MFPGDAAGGDPPTGKEAPQAFPPADPRWAAFPSLPATTVAAGRSPFLVRSGDDAVVLYGWTKGGHGCCSRESLSGVATHTMAHAVTTPWSPVDPSVGTRSSARDTEKTTAANVERADKLNKYPYPGHSYQHKTCYPLGNKEVDCLLPAKKEQWNPEQKSLHTSYELNGNETSFRSVPSFVRMLNDPGSPLDSNGLQLIKEETIPHYASSFYHDTVAKSRLEALPFLPRGKCNQIHVAADLAATHHVNDNQEVEAIENNELQLLIFTEEQNSGGRSDTLLHTRKRKVIRKDHFSSSNLNVDEHESKSHHFTAPSTHGYTSDGRNVSESIDSTRQLQNLFSPASIVGCPHVVYPYPCVDAKELEEREWIRLVQKQLTNSDVGSPGRIVLPKREAEANLPPLFKKDGLILEMLDMSYHIVWGFKYRFWPNNRSRMYILENTGDFVKMHKLETGDSLVIYGDKASVCYVVSVLKKSRQEIMITRNVDVYQIL